jgi:gamma-glutamylcyclotransferase (GGCT)/AIG2-like uncharacterized protein YtfP
MIERLFAYGTLKPGEINAHFLAQIPGKWIEASLIGFHFPSGYGATEGYPALIPSFSGRPIAGLVFEAEFTIDQWQMLDDFETDAYQRVMTKVTTTSKTCLSAYVYALNQDDLRTLKRTKYDAV